MEKKLSRSYYVTSFYDEDDTICTEIKALYARRNVLLPKLGHCTHDVKKNLLIHQGSNYDCQTADS